MIATIKGVVTEKSGEAVVIELGGIGYEVVVPTADLAAAKVGQPAKFYIYEHIREDIHALYGFANPDAKAFYIKLLTVSGIGPKVAMGVMSAAKLERLQQTVASGDAALLKGVAGVGAKTAERIVVELRGKVETGATGFASSNDPAYQALIGLGYSPAQAAEAVAQIPADITGEQARVKAALKQLS